MLCNLLKLLFIILIAVPCSWALEDPGTQLKDIGITPRLGEKLDLSTQFMDQDGKSVTLRELTLPDRPTIIVPAYYDCPRLCGLLLSGFKKLLLELPLKLGQDYSVVVSSFNVDDTVEKAAKRASEYRSGIQEVGGDPQKWHFLVGNRTSVDKLMTGLGFKYAKDGEDYVHAAAIFILTPQGEISQYFGGIDFDPKNVRMALVEASFGTIGTVMDQVFLFCFRYDHLQGKYTWAAFNFMRLGGFLTLSFLVFLIYRLWSRERRSRRGV